MSQPLTNAEVREKWDDAFLTDVIVPHLENIIGVFEVMEDKAGDEGTANVYEEYFYAAQINILAETIHILREWRG